MVDNPNWLAADDWKWAQDTLPILCVDVVPVVVGRDGRTVERVGLIHRDTPHQGLRWCIVGGRLWRGESLAQGATRQLRETLGLDVAFASLDDRQPEHIVQYFPSHRADGLYDPRQHAVTANFVVPIVGGEVDAGGEALSFHWYPVNQLPEPKAWGFRQDEIVAACLKRWHSQP